MIEYKVTCKQRLSFQHQTDLERVFGKVNVTYHTNYLGYFSVYVNNEAEITRYLLTNTFGLTIERQLEKL